MIPRILLNSINPALRPGRVWMLLGARRVGKTALINHYLNSVTDEKWYRGHGEDRDLAAILEARSSARLKQLLQGYDGFFLDEAQSVSGIGLSLKLIVDLLPHLKIIVTGSSAFHLDQLLGQPLTGRRAVHYLHPISIPELTAWKDPLAAQALLPELLVYGSYPELLQIGSPAERQDYLRQLVEDYLFQDILAFEQLRNPRKLRDLTTLIAHQIGSELSLNELANTLQINKATVERYLDLLEKSFVLFRMSGFSRNLRKEVAKTQRYYFIDNGIRNAVINNFQSIDLRPDRGALWENFFINERRRQHSYRHTGTQIHFWRTYDQQEIDLVEVDTQGGLKAFECKWQNKKRRSPAAWSKTYPEAPVTFVHPGNFSDFLDPA